MESYLNEAPCLYFSSTDDGRIVEVNQTLCNHLGYTRDELAGQKLEKIFTVPTSIFQQTHFFPLLKMHGHAEEVFITLQTKDKEQLPVLINAERTVSNQQGISVYIGIIVRNRKKFEDELVAARKAAETALNENTALLQAKQDLQKQTELLDQQITLVNKQNEELRQFSRVVTHDLQEPLRKLFVFLNMLLEKKDEQAALKTIERIKNVSEQMRAVLSGLQQYIWLTETNIRPTEVDLDKIIMLVKSRVENENPGIVIQIEKETLPEIEADRDQVHFLLHELLSNAVRFRKPGNEVRVHVTASSLQMNKFKNVSGKYQYTDYLKLQISDDGIGFDATYKDQVFELFKRLHPASGRGIGLSLCKKIMENHQGSLSIDSKVNKGTTVTVLLPFQKQYPASSENMIENLKLATRNDS